MNDNEKWHEPEVIENLRNGIVYILLTTFVTCGLALILCGMIAPVFWLKFNDIAEKLAEYNANKENLPRSTYLDSYRRRAAILLGAWFILSWLFAIAAWKMNGGFI